MTDANESKGFVKREALLKLLGYSQNYYFKGFNSGKGIKEISSEMAFELEKMFHVESGESIHNSNNKNADR